MRFALTSKRMRPALAITGALCIAFGALNAQAERLYLNDVDITNAKLKNWTLKNVDQIEFDENGDVRITAPGYNVKVVSSNTTSSGTTSSSESTASQVRKEDLSAPITVHYDADVSLSHRYLLTLANPDRTKVPYDVDVLINGKHAVTYTHTRGNASMDVSEFMERGENTISFIARRVPGQSPSQGHAMKVLLGVGSYNGRVAKYEHILVGMEYKSTDDRSDIRNSQKFTIK